MIVKLLLLYWEFFKVGLFTFGGGYGSLRLIEEVLLAHEEWGISSDMFSYILGVAESTPGPVMVNTATYVGTTCAGPIGGFVATLGAITPSFVIILLIAKCLKGFLERKDTRAALDAVKPCIVGIILAMGIKFILLGLIPAFNTVFVDGFTKTLIPEWKTVLMFALVFLMRFGWKKWKKKAISPILSIGVSAVLGIVIFGV